MIKYKIVLVPFPFDDFSATKVRPAICLTNPVGKFNHIIIAFISSKIQQELIESDLLILKSDKGFKATGLISDSIIRVHKIVTIPKNLIHRELGMLDVSLQKVIHKKIQKLFKN